MGHQCNQEYRYINLYGYEVNNPHFLRNHMDQHIFHFDMLWWYDNPDPLNIHMDYK